MTDPGVVIVGAGHAGAQCAISLRQLKYAGRITLLTDEPQWPYERPPLSKDYLAGDRAFDSMLIRPAAYWRENGIDLRVSNEVVEVVPSTRAVTLSDGISVSYETLVWAAGGRARRLACDGHASMGVHSVRTRADVDALRSDGLHAKRVVIVGGGYIGLETAAILSKAGMDVVVIEALDRVLARVAGPELSAFYEAEHRAHGVEIRTRAVVERIEERGGRAVGVRLAGGEHLPADLVIVGVGIEPNVEPLVAAGAQVALAGILVDLGCRTSIPHVYAAGDCATHVSRWTGAEVRIESVQNAGDQASVIAKQIVGQPSEYDALPWFWSNQYDLRLQTVGLSSGHDTRVLRGDPHARSFSLVYLKRGVVVALDCVNSPRDYAFGRKLVSSRSTPDPALLADASASLKDLAA